MSASIKMATVALRWIVLCGLVVGVAVMVAVTWPQIDDTPAAVAPIAVGGAVMVGVTLLARAKLTPQLSKLIVAPLAFLAAFCGYGAGAEWWANGVSNTWPFLTWGLIVGPLPIVLIAAWRRFRRTG